MTLNKEENRIYLQGKLDLLKEIKEKMYGQVIGYSLKGALLEDQWKEIKDDIEKQLGELSD